MRKLKNEELGRKSIAEFRKADKTPIVIVLDNIRSLHNVGSVFRTADGFLITAVYLCGITAQPPHREIQKTALGATESVEWKYYSNTVDALMELAEQGYKLVAVEQAEDSIGLSDFKVEREHRYAIVFGHEVKGVSQEAINQCGACIEIHQLGTKHSLNISVAVGVVVWSFLQKMGIK